MTWHQWHDEYPTERRIGRSSALARSNASLPQGYQSTGLSACWRRYGLDWVASRFGMAFLGAPDPPGAPGSEPGRPSEAKRQVEERWIRYLVGGVPPWERVLPAGVIRSEGDQSAVLENRSNGVPAPANDSVSRARRLGVSSTRLVSAPAVPATAPPLICPLAPRDRVRRRRRRAADRRNGEVSGLDGSHEGTDAWPQA